jgi:2-iminobutanoate/2-iminopropanoate deaminase
VTAQTERAFERIGKVLKTAGYSFDDVVKMNVYLLNAEDYRPMNEVRKRLFAQPYPASTVVVVKELVLPEALVEIEVIVRSQ